MAVRAGMRDANGFDQRRGNLRRHLEDRGDLGMSLAEQRNMRRSVPPWLLVFEQFPVVNVFLIGLSRFADR
jgi:hypothetical protein